MISKIKSEGEYSAALLEIEQLIDKGARVGTPAGDRLNILTLIVQQYEQELIGSHAPDPLDAIKFRMEQMNLSPRDLVPLIGSRSKVSEVLAGKRPLTLSMVRALNKGLGIPAKSLIREPLLFDSTEESIEWGRFPIREMASRGWLSAKPSDISQRPKELMREFLSPLGSDWAPRALYKQTRYIRSARQMDRYALAAWDAQVCVRALRAPPRTKFDRSVVNNMKFLHELAHLSALNTGPRQAVEYLAGIGILVLIEPHLPEMHIDGAALLASPELPVVGLTLRHDRIDNFWFVLMHELIHIGRHLGSETVAIYDDLDIEDNSSENEREADHLAGEALIPNDEWSLSPARNLRTPEAVRHLANKLRIHPAIVAGRIRHHYKSYRVLNRLVGQGEVRRLFPETALPGGDKHD